MLGEREDRQISSLALLLSAGPPLYCTTLSPGTLRASRELQLEMAVTGTMRRWGPGLASLVTRWDSREVTGTLFWLRSRAGRLCFWRVSSQSSSAWLLSLPGDITGWTVRAAACSSARLSGG